MLSYSTDPEPFYIPKQSRNLLGKPVVLDAGLSLTDRAEWSAGFRLLPRELFTQIRLVENNPHCLAGATWE